MNVRRAHARRTFFIEKDLQRRSFFLNFESFSCASFSFLEVKDNRDGIPVVVSLHDRHLFVLLFFSHSHRSCRKDKAMKLETDEPLLSLWIERSVNHFFPHEAEFTEEMHLVVRNREDEPLSLAAIESVESILLPFKDINSLLMKGDCCVLATLEDRFKRQILSRHSHPFSQNTAVSDQTRIRAYSSLVFRQEKRKQAAPKEKRPEIVLCGHYR